MFTYIIIVALMILFLYEYGTRNYYYWRNRGVIGDKTIPFFGTDLRLILNKTSMSQHYADMYWRYPTEKLVGFYRAATPYILIRDPELVKRVLITDFNMFYSRGIVPYKDDPEPMFKNLFTVDGDKWRLLRQSLSPMFSSAKLKATFPLIIKRADELQSIAANAASHGFVVDLQDMMARYTTDFIGTFAFGINMDSLKDENSKFRRLGKRIFTITTRDVIVGAIKSMFPVIGSNLKYIAPEVEDGILHLMNSVMEQRNYESDGRNDFIDALLQMRKKGNLLGEAIEHKNLDGSPKAVSMEINDNLIAAQLFIFFAAGFETSSMASSLALHQLAFHPEKQKKVHEEIDKILEKYDNNLCYKAINEMEYLQMVLLESLRILPPVGTIMRKCTSKYTFPGTAVTIDEDVGVLIPIYAFHHDPKYFENPDEFKPERFHPNNRSDVKKFTFLPFGEGRRACIGARLGMLQTMTGMAALLQKFTITPTASSRRHPILDTGFNVTQSIVGGLPVILKERK